MDWIKRRSLIREPSGVAKVARDLFENSSISIAVRAPDETRTWTRLRCGGTLFIPEQEVAATDPATIPTVKTYTAPKLLLVGCDVSEQGFHFDFIFIPLRPAGVVGTATSQDLVIESGRNTIHITREPVNRKTSRNRAKHNGMGFSGRLEHGVAHVSGQLFRPLHTDRLDSLHSATDIAYTAEAMFGGMPVAIILESHDREPVVLVTYFQSLDFMLRDENDIEMEPPGSYGEADWDQFASGIFIEGLTLHETDLHFNSIALPLPMPERTEGVIQDEHLFVTGENWSMSIVALKHLEMG